MSGPALPPPIFDAAAYLAGMRALGSFFYVTRDTATGREGFAEGHPVEGWSGDGYLEMIRLRGLYAGCPDAARRIADILIQEGEIHLWSSTAPADSEAA